MTALSAPPVSAIADVLALFGRDGWLTPPLRPIVPAPDVVRGRAVTIELCREEPGRGISALHELVSTDLHGCVVVIAGAVPIEGAVWGEIMSRAARGQGAVGVLVDGSVRDRLAMQEEGLPIYAVDERVVGPAGKASVASVGAPVRINGVTIEPGACVVMDPTGVVHVTDAETEHVLHAAALYSSAEVDVIAGLARGEPLREAYRHKRDAVTALTQGR